MKVVRLSDLSTGYLYSKEISLVLISVRGSVDPRARVWPEGLSQLKFPVTPSGDVCLMAEKNHEKPQSVRQLMLDINHSVDFAALLRRASTDLLMSS
jgi:hypothetical protein